MQKWLAGLVVAIAGSSVGAEAQSFATKPITVIVPFAAGGPSDVVARVLAPGMAKVLGQQVVIENTTGAAGSIGSAKAAKSAPDGHVLVLGHLGTHCANVALYPSLPYHPATDFEPVVHVLNVPFVLVAKKALPTRDLTEFVTWLKANQKTATAATAGAGSGSHLASILMSQALGVSFEMASYRGTGPAMNDVVAGQIDFMFDQATTAVPQIRGQTVLPLAVTSLGRNPALPEVPSVGEKALPNLEVTLWQAYFAPKGTPKPVVDQLYQAVQTALADPGTREKLVDLGADIMPPERARPEALAQFLQAELAKWTPIIKAANVKVD